MFMFKSSFPASHLVLVSTLAFIFKLLFKPWYGLILGASFLQIEPIRNLFAALFLACVGMLIHVHFLWNHVDILLAAVILVIITKTIVTATVVKCFGYTNKTSLRASLLPAPHRFHFAVHYVRQILSLPLHSHSCRSACLWHRLGNSHLFFSVVRQIYI